MAPLPPNGYSGPPSATAPGGYNHKAWNHRSNGNAYPAPDKSLSLPAALRGVEEASAPSDWVLHCASAALEHPMAGRSEAEAVLTKLSAWLAPPAAPQVLSHIASSSIPNAVVHAIRKFRNEPPAAALACVVVVRSAGSFESAVAHIRAGAIEEVSGLMDRHPSHGGIQNVCLLLLCVLLKDNGTAQQAVTHGIVQRVMRAMEATAGREVQYNGLAALRLLLDKHMIVDSARVPRAGLQEAAMRAKATHLGDSALIGVADDVLSIVTPRFKEVLCWHWQSGWCKLGPRCTYAHGSSDLRKMIG